MKVTVARIGRAVGLKGEVALDVRTDVPERRLVAGARFETDPPDAGPLTLTLVRQQSGRWIATFEQIADRDAAESARGIELVIDAAESDEEDAWYVHELMGLRAERPDGEVVGEVVDLLDLPAHDVLVVRQPDGFRAMIPFIEAFVPTVDVRGGRVIVTPPHGLLSGEEPENTGETAGAP
jgi:16S rRNA processing protein RimM